MIGILWGKIRLLFRKAGSFIVTTIICMVFAFFLGKSTYSEVKVPVYSSLPDAEVEEFVNELNKSESFKYVIETEETVKNKVADGTVEAGIELKAESYTLYQVGKTGNYHLINEQLNSFYSEKIRDNAVREQVGDSSDVMETLKKAKANPLFELSVSSFSDQNKWVHDPSLQSLFGFALFFSIYTVAFSVVEILREKQEGIWDRLILSPISKFGMYAGNLLYSLILGYVQIALIFLVFKYGAGVDFHGGFGKTLILIIPYLFTIIAMSIFIAGLVKTIGQFNALIPLISVSFAMLGGAYWPIEIVTSDILLTISKGIPITYGMEILKGVTVSGLSYSDVLLPISILLLMGVALMGVGIRLMESRHV